jgi:hypothetical protein
MKNTNDVSLYINWKDRAKNRRIENKALKKRIKELTISRDKWKIKAQYFQKKYEDASNSLKSLEKAFKKNFC